MKRLRWLPGVLLAAVCTVAPASAQSPPFDFVGINVPPGYPANQTLYGGGINNAGQIVGNVLDLVRWGQRGFLDDHGSFTILDASLTDGATYANAINNHGEVVGTYFDSYFSQLSHGFVWKDGVFTTVDVPSASRTEAWGMNDSGEIVGTYFVGAVGHAFLFKGGRFTTIDPPGADSATARGINNHGQIVGNYILSSHTHGFHYQAGRFTDIDVPNAERTDVRGINDTGDFVGRYFGADHVSHVFLYRGGLFHNIDVPPALVYGELSVPDATGINASGQILGSFADWRSYHLYLANPLPSPHVTLVNDSVTFEPIQSTYSITGSCFLGTDIVPSGPIGELFTFVATLTAGEQATAFSDAFVQVATLTPDRILAEVGGEGAFTPVPRIGHYGDGLLTPGDSVDVTFGVCLPTRDPFELTVDVWGRPQP